MLLLVCNEKILNFLVILRFEAAVIPVFVHRFLDIEQIWNRNDFFNIVCTLDHPSKLDDLKVVSLMDRIWAFSYFSNWPFKFLLWSLTIVIQIP
jgi:hypothetical protein